MSTAAELLPPRRHLVQLLRQAEAERTAGQRTAVQLMREVPGWFVMWGSGSRVFHAFPLANGATRQSSADPYELIYLMRKESARADVRHQAGRLTTQPGTRHDPSA
jgi:hypothetical protein